jgi:hypothetical protein
MKTIFSFDFITSEFILNDLRVHSLAYDEESVSFIIMDKYIFRSILLKDAQLTLWISFLFPRGTEASLAQIQAKEGLKEFCR